MASFHGQKARNSAPAGTCTRTVTGAAVTIGTLLGRAGRCDVTDGSLIDAAADGDEILTTDPDDIMALAHNSGKNLIVTRI